jgi:hypothetical protein
MFTMKLYEWQHFSYYHLKNVQIIVYTAFDYHLLYRSLGKFQFYKKKDSIVLMQIKL